MSDSPERRSFNQDELDDIQTIVAEIIATNAPLTITQTKNFLKSESTHLTTLIEDQEMVKKKYKRLKYLQRKQPSDAVQNIDEVDRSERTSDWVAETVFKESHCLQDDKTGARKMMRASIPSSLR